MLKEIMKQLLLTFAVLALTASFSHAGKVVYTYDPLGQIESITNSTATSHYTPDRTGNMMHGLHSGLGVQGNDHRDKIFLYAGGIILLDIR